MHELILTNSVLAKVWHTPRLATIWRETQWRYPQSCSSAATSSPPESLAPILKKNLGPSTHYAHFMEKRRTGKAVALVFMILFQPLLLNPTPVQAATSGKFLHLRIASPESDYPVRDVYVWTPPLGKFIRSSLPVVYMLHGWPGSPSSMISAVVKPLTAAFAKGTKPFIAVFPDGNAKTHADLDISSSTT